MEVISTNQISDPNAQQPFTGPSLKFLQDALRKDDAGIIEALVKKIVGTYSLTVPYVISGCVVTDANKDVTAGTIFYGGKFYETTAVNGTTNVARFILTKTQDATADPVLFTDGSNKNVHDIYKYVATDVASGGDFISTDLVYLSAVTGKDYSQTTLATQALTSNSFIDATGLTKTTPNDGKTRVYMLTFKGVVVNVSAAAEGLKLRIYNDTLTSSLDESATYFDLATATLNVNRSTVMCQAIVSLAPGTVLKCQVATYNSISMDIENANFIAVEI